MPGFDVLTRGDVLHAALKARDYLVSCGVPGSLAAKDPRLWGRRAVDHSRLGWLDLPSASRGLLAQVDGLVADARASGLDHVVLIAVGAEALAAQAIVAARPPGAGGELTVLDGGDTAGLGFTLERLDRTLVVLASKSGVSLEGDAYRRILTAAFRERGLSEKEIAARFLVVTDHGSPLHGFARQCGYRIGLTDPYLPGHFGALSAYGLVPAVLAGADAGTLLDEAAEVVPSLSRTEDNPGLLLGAILGGCAQQGPEGLARDKLLLRERGGPGPLTAWIAQLLAVGTGKRGRGVVTFEPPGVPRAYPDLHAVAINPAGAAGEDDDTSVWGPVGAQFLVWEYATAIAGWLLGVNPFEAGGASAQDAEDQAATMLQATAGGRPVVGRPVAVDGDIEIHTDLAWRGGSDLESVLTALLDRVPGTGYLAVASYLSGEFSGRYLAPSLARGARRPVAYGPGPGYLHATGAVHKDGPGTGAFLVVTGDPPAGDPLGDLAVPGRPYGLATLQFTRGVAEARALRQRGLPVVHLHLRDPVGGAGRLAAAARAAAVALS
ncbi:Glucose-6-phosphate isomerase [Actinomadura rubteroloni]|uniref:Glucose-6-phosphate isomerase n=1 Tax=Actinomadura rubteroloni TaxID=1926885 RepID=A0A2P4UBB2_9ACTN|nr:phosphoheptose isomerase [Actinomadura rubteroloni]POM22322.1 Glucose-6-phosphate isomerase [Actinomadura rubteroloni]